MTDLDKQALADLVAYQRETIRLLNNKLDRAKLCAETLDSQTLFEQACNDPNAVFISVPKKLIDDLREALK